MTLNDGRVYYRTASKGTSLEFIAFMRQLLRNFPNRMLLLVVDNSSIHKSKQVRTFLAKYHRIRLFYLPTYSPEYNPIERFWLWMKKQLNGGGSYLGSRELKSALRSLLLRHNENWHDAPIKFDFGIWKKLKNLVQGV